VKSLKGIKSNKAKVILTISESIAGEMNAIALQATSDGAARRRKKRGQE
jgi:hypothetical protein